MALDDEIRQAERDGNHALAERLRARTQAADEGYSWKTLDGKVLRLHQITDDHLENIIKLKIRRATGGMRLNRLVGLFDMSMVSEDGYVAPLSSVDDLALTKHLIDQTMRRVSKPLLDEADRRNMSREKFVAYAFDCFQLRCDECKKHGAVPRGPADRFQCNECAKGWELRCMSCNLMTTDPPTQRNRKCSTPGCEQTLAWVPKGMKK